jgi:hypothetical protein
MSVIRMSASALLSVANLNADLLNIVCTYMLHKEQLEFISTNQSIREKSKVFRYLSLNENKSLEFCEDISFCNKCLSLIKNASRQMENIYAPAITYQI